MLRVLAVRLHAVLGFVVFLALGFSLIGSLLASSDTGFDQFLNWGSLVLFTAGITVIAWSQYPQRRLQTVLNTLCFVTGGGIFAVWLHRLAEPTTKGDIRVVIWIAAVVTALLAIIRRWYGVVWLMREQKL